MPKLWDTSEAMLSEKFIVINTLKKNKDLESIA